MLMTGVGGPVGQNAQQVAVVHRQEPGTVKAKARTVWVNPCRQKTVTCEAAKPCGATGQNGHPVVYHVDGE